MNKQGWAAIKGSRSWLAILAAMFAVVLAALPAAASGHVSQTSKVVMLDSNHHVIGIVDGAEADLGRDAGGISMQLSTLGLNGGDAYTVWWIVFNNPAACITHALPGLACGPKDLSPSQIQAAQVDVLYAAGHVVGSDGPATFAGHLSPGDSSQSLFGGPGLTNLLGAEVHLIVRDHGPADPPDVSKQTIGPGSFGVCNTTCHDSQAAAFAPAS